MTYHSDHSPDSARENQLDQRQNGILNYDQRNAWNEGQAAIALGSSSTGVEVDLEGANVLIDGSKVSVPPNTITLSNGHSDLWRLDHIYATMSGNYAVQEGEPRQNTYVEHAANDGQVVEVIRENETAGGPAPKGPDFSQTQGELMYSVLVPPGTTTPQGLTFPQHVHDRRRLAPDVLDLEMPRQPAISSQHFNLDENGWEMWPIVVWPGQTFRLWEYTLTQADLGMMGTDALRLYLVDFSGIDRVPREEFSDEGGDGIDWSEYAVWETGQTRQSSRGDPEEIIYQRDITGDTDSHAFVIANVGDGVFGAKWNQIGFQATYTIENTEDL